MKSARWTQSLVNAESVLGCRATTSSSTASTSTTAKSIIKTLLKNTSKQQVSQPSMATRLATRIMSSSRIEGISALDMQKSFFYTPHLLQMQMHTRRNSSTSTSSVIDPVNLSFMTANMHKLIQSQHPLLNTVASYYLNSDGKKIRPLIVLLMSHATKSDTEDLELVDHATLAMITEMIHTASLLHDDVIDDAATRRSLPSVNVAFGNKMAILGGDYLLSKASLSLARLGRTKVVELMAEVIGELVEGEVMQFRGNSDTSDDKSTDGGRVGGDDEYETLEWITDNPESMFSANSGMPFDVVFGDTSITDAQRQYFERYLRKTFMKTASLIAKSCRCSVLLHSTQSSLYQDAAFRYGKHVGIAFQLIDDMLDFTESSQALGKPSDGSDLKLGLATAPVLFTALDRHPLELWPLIDKKNRKDSSQKLDIENAIKLVRSGRGLPRTLKLAEWHSERAVDAALALPFSPYRDALVDIAKTLLTRTK